MKRAGRPSANSLSIVPVSEISPQERLKPPALLTDLERDVFLMVVNDQPANAFTKVHEPSIVAYSRHKIQSDILAESILNFNKENLTEMEGLKQYELLLKMHARETSSMQAIARSLRITCQSVDQQTRARMNEKNVATRDKKPWET